MERYNLPSNPLQTLKNGSLLVIPDFYEPEEFLGTLTLGPYRAEELKPGDVVLVQLDEELRFPVTNEEDSKKGSHIFDRLTDGSYIIEIGLYSQDETFYASFNYNFFEYSGQCFLCPFTKDMIYGKALDRDHIFSTDELISDLVAPSRVTPQDTSQLEVQNYLLSASTKSLSRVLYVFSATKELYPKPTEFWLDCEEYIWNLSLDSSLFRSRNFYESDCYPLPVANVNLVFQQWLDGVTEKPTEIIPVAEAKRAMFMIYNGTHSQALFVETADKWFAPIWYCP